MGGSPKNEIMTPEDMKILAAEQRQTRLYSKVEDNGEKAQALVAHIGTELATAPQKIDLMNEHMIMQVADCYVRNCAEAGVIPNKIGFCRAMGISRQGLDWFLNHHGDKPSAERIRIILDSFAEMLDSAALASVVHPIIAIFTLKAQSGWRDTISVEQEIKQDPLGEKIKAEEIVRKYQDLADFLPD